MVRSREVDRGGINRQLWVTVRCEAAYAPHGVMDCGGKRPSARSWIASIEPRKYAERANGTSTAMIVASFGP